MVSPGNDYAKTSVNLLRRLSLQKKLPLLIGLLLLLVIIAFTTISYSYFKKTALAAGQMRVNDVSQQFSSIFSRSAVMLMRTTLASANSVPFKNFAQPTISEEKKEEILDRLEDLRLDSSWVLTELVDTDFNPTYFRGNNELFHSAKRTEMVSLSTLEKDSVVIGKLIQIDSNLYYAIIATIYSEGKKAGYLLRWRVQSASPESLAQFSTLMGDGAKLFVGNSDGSIWTDLVHVVSAPSDGQNNKLAITTPIQGTSWLLYVKLSEALLLKPVRQSLQWLLLIGSILFIAGLLVTWVISRKVTIPIEQLTRAATQVANGDYDVQVNLSRKDELGQLALGFNKMLEKIKSSYKRQEEMVTLRTAQLEDNLVQLKASEDRFKGLLESAPDATIIVDEAGIIKLVNKQAAVVFGYSHDELLGSSVEVLIPINLRDRHKSHRSNYFDEPRVRAMGLGLELFAIRKDGTTFPVEISLSPLRTQTGLLVTAAVRDITERKKTEESIREVNRELESFTYSVSHDLRAPLRIMDGYADMLVEDYAVKLDAEGNRILSVIKANARRMGQLIDDLLNLSHTGRKELDRESVDMDRLVKTVIRDQLHHNSEGITINIDNLLPSKADASLIQQVWINLISNAIKYSSKTSKPNVEINSRQNGVEIEYSIKDNGVGFDMKYADKLFGVFQRLHKPTEFEGTGIGLALAHRIVKRHGGRIWANASPGEGATFTFTLPA